MIERTNIASNSTRSDAGVLADEYSAPILEDVQLIRNGDAGLKTRRYSFPLVRGSRPGVSHSVITQNRYGVRAESNSVPRLGNVLRIAIQTITV